MDGAMLMSGVDAQRFKGFNLDSFLDGKIAEEQAKQAQQSRPSSSSSPAQRRTPSTAGASRRSSARTDSPSQRPSSKLRVPDGENATPSKGPDPEDFVIGDDASDISRATTPVPTPRPVKEGANGPMMEEAETTERVVEKEDAEAKPETQDVATPQEKGKEKVSLPAAEDQLPEDVRKKLARLENLTAKYQGMLLTHSLHRDWHLLLYSQNTLCTDLLRNYRTAHARVASIEPFEATLREHTPLASIADPGALVEFLDQRGVQSDMVMEELKRVSAENREVVKERDELKVKLEEAESKAKEAFDEAAGLRKQREAGKDVTATQEAVNKDGKAEEADPLGATSVETREEKATPTAANSQADAEDETFFSYETEVSRLESEMSQRLTEIQEQKDYINELSTENATLRRDYDMCQLNLSAMQNKITIKEREIGSVQTALQGSTGQLQETKDQLAEALQAKEQQDQDAAASLVETESQIVDLENKLKGYQQSLKESNKELEDKAAAAEENLRKYQKEHDENLKNGKYVQREERMKEIHQNVVTALKEQVKVAEEAQTVAEGRVKELQFENTRMESEADASGELITRLRGHESAAESLRKRLVDVEHERDEAYQLAESKKGHEAAGASLRSQLKSAVKDRDAAYQMIIECGKCAIPERDEVRSLETPTERSSTPRSRSRNSSELTERTEVSTQLTEVSTPSAPDLDGEVPAAGEGKKKNKKKKSKAKKKEVSDVAVNVSTPDAAIADVETPPSIEELIENPEKASTIFLGRRDDKQLYLEFVKKSMQRIQDDRLKEDEEHAELLRHHEQHIEERDQMIRENVKVIKEREDEIGRLKEEIKEQDGRIERLDSKLKGEEELREEAELLKEDVIDARSESTDAKYDLTILREQKAKLQAEFDELHTEDDRTRKSLKEAEVQRDVLVERCTGLETEIVELKNAQSVASEAQMQQLRDKLEAAETSGAALAVAKEACEKQIDELTARHAAHGEESDAKHASLSEDFKELRTKASDLEKDLDAANQLAQTRFKDLTDLRELLGKLQPEAKRLREESVELKMVREEVEKTGASVKKLEGRERDLRAEIAEYKSQVSGKGGEIAALREKVKKGEERSSALEDTYERTRKDLEGSERTRDEAVEVKEKVQVEMKKADDRLKNSWSSLNELEKQVQNLRDEASGLRDEVRLKTAQQASAQSVVDSLQDQARELATQMREVREKNESLDEEVADAHRLLSERGRDGETLRRLLADAEGRAEGKVKEMRERMDLAVEERDRAEEEAGEIGRRKGREIEDLKTKLRDAERESGRATEAKDGAEKRERELRSGREELERAAKQAQEELDEVRAAMRQLRDALDEGERVSRLLEKEKAELSKSLEEREARLERLQKSSKGMAEELRSLQSASKLRHGSMQSSRSSMDVSSPRVTSPVPKGNANNGSLVASSGGGGEKGVVDMNYLKNVLLQFLEQREKKHQMQLVPVLGMLLHFDR